MSPADATRDLYRTLSERLLARRENGVWVGELSSSALSTATAVIALATASPADDGLLVDRGLQWLVDHQNRDGGWGDTTASASNISTTALCWAALTYSPARDMGDGSPTRRCEAWLTQAAGALTPAQLRSAIAERYGKDRTFSAPILTALAIAGRLGSDGWRWVPPLPFELAVCPQRWFQYLQLPVVSYALPALIAIGQARHHQRPSRNLLVSRIRRRCRPATLDVLRAIQPQTGGYLEATPLTSFVVMSLVAAGQSRGPVVHDGVAFLRASVRQDGSWPIDTNLSTWVTTLSINALASAGGLDERLSLAEREHLATWLLQQQYRDVHPYTGAAPGGWAWTPLPGGVPDADDTAGALVALRQLAVEPAGLLDAVSLGVGWLLQLQNRDGGVPTFCRGWGALPFDRSAPDLTAHALLAWDAWRRDLSPSLVSRINVGIARALAYLRSAQRADGAWMPLWFGNENSPDEGNAAYGTAKVVGALSQLAPASDMLHKGRRWLLLAQNTDGGWGASHGVSSSVEETAFAVDALAAGFRDPLEVEACRRGLDWLLAHTGGGNQMTASPIGLYFAKLWYFESLYPLIFATGALGTAIRAGAPEGSVSWRTPRSPSALARE